MTKTFPFQGKYIVDEETGDGRLELNGMLYEVPAGQPYARLEEHFKRLITDMVNSLCRKS